jgi:hypothetical protein
LNSPLDYALPFVERRVFALLNGLARETAFIGGAIMACAARQRR